MEKKKQTPICFSLVVPLEVFMQPAEHSEPNLDATLTLFGPFSYGPSLAHEPAENSEPVDMGTDSDSVDLPIHGEWDSDCDSLAQGLGLGLAPTMQPWGVLGRKAKKCQGCNQI